MNADVRGKGAWHISSARFLSCCLRKKMGMCFQPVFKWVFRSSRELLTFLFIADQI